MNGYLHEDKGDIVGKGRMGKSQDQDHFLEQFQDFCATKFVKTDSEICWFHFFWHLETVSETHVTHVTIII